MQECNTCAWSRWMAHQWKTQVCENIHAQGIVTESSECQSRSLISGTQSNSVSSTESVDTHVSKMIQQTKLEHMEQTLTDTTNILESISKRYCNGMMGVPITFVDKLNPEQFRLIGQGQGNLYRLLTPYGLSKQFVDDYYASGQKGSIKENHPVLGYYNVNHKPIIPYMRLVIQKIN